MRRGDEQPELRTVTAADILSSVAKETGASKELLRQTAVVIFDALASSLSQGNDVKIRGLGSFRWVQQRGRSTGPVQYPDGYKLKFFPSRRIKRK